MLLTGGALTVALVTTHVALAEVPRLVTGPEIERVGALLAGFLLTRRGKPARIAVAGLNPHAGESGAMGREELDTIAPAVARMAAQWHGRATFTGPISPDTLFMRAAAGEFDGVLCMYHDQGLIPLKLHAFDQGVNVTLGLPFVRTSPDHGTAFEIAGRGIARPESTLAAIRLAAELVERRKGELGSQETRKGKGEGDQCIAENHDFAFSDNFPDFEIFECRKCRLRKFVDLKTGNETFQ